MAESRTVQPLTFQKLPWVAGIDSLPNREWLESFPDGKALLCAMLPGQVADDAVVNMIAPHLRDLARLMVQGMPNSDFNSMLIIISVLSDAPIWKQEGSSYQKALRDDMEKLNEFFPSCRVALEVFRKHVEADAEHWLRQSELSHAHTEAQLQGRADH
ncbi:MAG: hypothetical protein KW802_04425 [Candidatus Doudnabacteria bacterium]|nr:hypothetical protein [Candidatus Doudnabacteria bacterium]